MNIWLPIFQSSAPSKCFYRGNKMVYPSWQPKITQLLVLFYVLSKCVCASCVYVWLMLEHIQPCMANSGRQGEERRWRDRIGPASCRTPCILWGRTGGPWANTDITSKASSCLARQPHVNITSMPTHTQIFLQSHVVSQSQAFNCNDAVIDWTIAFSYSSWKANKSSYWLFCFWLIQQIWFPTSYSVVTLSFQNEHTAILPGILLRWHLGEKLYI